MSDSRRTEFTERHFAAFGRLLVAFQELETLIEHFLMVLICDRPTPSEPNDRIARLLLSETGFTKKLDILKEAIRTIPDAHLVKENDEYATVKLEELKEFRQVVKQALNDVATVRTERNRLFHSTYLTHPIAASPATVVRTKSRLSAGGVKVEWAELSAEDIDSVIETAHSAIAQLQSASSFFRHLRAGNLTTP